MTINPNIIRFMQHDRMTLAGTMISGGFLYMQIARYGVRYGMYWAKKAIHIAGVVGFLGILLFIGFGYFDWLHGLLWLILLPFFFFFYWTNRNFAEHPASIRVIDQLYILQRIQHLVTVPTITIRKKDYGVNSHLWFLEFHLFLVVSSFPQLAFPEYLYRRI